MLSLEGRTAFLQKHRPACCASFEPLGVGALALHHLDELQLDAVGTFEEAHPPAAADRCLFKNVDAMGLDLVPQASHFIGVNRNVLHAILLFAVWLSMNVVTFSMSPCRSRR